MNNNIALEIKNITKKFGNSGIEDVNFKVKKGTFHVLIGPNGAGKTTLIRTILNLYQEYSGEILINNINSKNPEAFKGLTYISENPIFPSEFDVYSYLKWVGLLAGLNNQFVDAKINNLSKKFGISSSLKKNPNKLSSGEKQKVMLMKTIIQDSDLIIMDEPTANLDPTTRIIFFEEIHKMFMEGKTIFLCSHNLEEINDKADHVTILQNGSIIYDSKRKNKGESLLTLFKKYTKNTEELLGEK